MNHQRQLTSDAVFQTGGMIEPAADSAKSPVMVFSIIRRYWLSIILVAGVLSALTVLTASRMKPAFVSTASVLLEQHSPTGMDISVGSAMIATDAVGVRTQVDILKSADLARGIVRDLRLVDLPEFSPHPGSLGKWIQLLGIHGSSAQVPLTKAQRQEFAAQTLLGLMNIVNDGRSYVIDIKAKVTDKTHDPQRVANLSAILANTYADAYVRFTGDTKSISIRKANSLFDDRINTLKEKMRQAESAVETYRAKNDLVEDSASSTDGHSVTIIGQQMAHLNAELSQATAERAGASANLQQAGSGRGGFQSVPEVVASPLIQNLRQQQALLRARAASLAMTRGEGSEELVAVQAGQRAVTEQIDTETAKIVSSLRGLAGASRARENTLSAALAELQTKVGTQGQTAVQLHELQNEADIARLLYTSYLKRFEETANQINMQEPDATVISHASVPLGASPPSKSAVMVAGMMVSVFIAVFVALVRERMQSGFRNSAQIEAGLGIETLGIIPKVARPREALLFTNRFSQFSEAVYSARALLRMKRHGAAQVAMITSALPREGKTFCALALARSSAIAGERVLLIDCNLRRPPGSKNVVAKPLEGLEGVAVWRDELSMLDMMTLTCGNAGPQDMFGSMRMRELIASMRDRYDLILLDTPPVLAVSDARILAPLADIIVLVVCWQKTPQHLVTAAVAALRGAGAAVAGALISQVKFGNLDQSDGADAYSYRVPHDGGSQLLIKEAARGLAKS
ncbi:MAG: GumC family protein [Janthinobacterium lividum]